MTVGVSLDPAPLLDEATGQLADAVALRRDLHRWPEVGNELPRTRERLLEALDGLPLDIVRHDTTSGFTALLTGDRPGPTILLRADMDALPMPEESGVEFSSKVAGSMHACGHDTHVAMLTGSAKLLCDRRNELAGRVLFMYQPGEEGHHGARHMLDEGLLDVPALADGTPSPVSRAFALHITSSLPTGWIASRGGAALASADTLTIDVIGAGGHASEPFRTRDPIPVACEIVQALQTMVTRTINVFDPAVVTVASISAGTTDNVIPERARILGTIRAVSEATRATVHAHLSRVAEGVAAAHGLEAVVTIDAGYPVTVNDAGEAAHALDIARVVAGPRQVVEMPNPVMGAEDFSYVLQRVPGSMAFLGGTPLEANPATVAPNHSTKVVFDEQAMVTGIATYAAVALDALG